MQSGHRSAADGTAAHRRPAARRYLATVMADYQTYRARADAQRAELVAATTSPFTIEIRFLGGPNLRPAAAGASAFLPAKGIMSFDTADLAQMATAGTLRDVITHEMGHVLGIGTLWEQKDLLKRGGTSNPTFAGPSAMEEYRRLRGDGRRRRVPVENTGGPGTRDGHWRETVFRNELMSGFISEPGNPLSRVTAASLGDLGYQVDIDAAEPYELPNLLAVAESGALVAHAAPIDVGIVLPVIPITLPRDSLQEGLPGTPP